MQPGGSQSEVMPISAKPDTTLARRFQCLPGVCHSKACRSVGFCGVGIAVSFAALTAGGRVVPLSGATSLSTLQKNIRPARSWVLHLRASRKPSNRCALLRSHEAMIGCVLLRWVKDNIDSKKIRSFLGVCTDQLIYVC